ncbi:NAD-dependent epimerase/dehydratase family protein [Texcoconibacillus texcoconensis]|uniref:Uncharacterized protein YbjT (DUF2867 family) n=1 Tax=Texcoconibacillus texcoconensis TaxID=1095777 RepID=A0A840QS29_9BACI|nr:NAD-dependent epimerase/dehydratase family protein [Texcoconibacillus texcoconensis]MBB5174139.1 uncharacterized protein YbjT (DUF2867 family) [Texcoconibacillus texcoconensis]
MKTALVAGATGLIGDCVVEDLLNEDVYDEVILFVRRPTRFQNHKKIREYMIDFDDLHTYMSDLRVDDIFICLGTTMKEAKSKKGFMKVDYTYPLKLAKEAKIQSAARVLIVSAIKSDRDGAFFYTRVKGKLEEELIALQLESLHIFRPSLLTGHRSEFRVKEKTAEIFSKSLSPLLTGPFEKYKPIPAKYVSSVMVTVAQEESKGVHIYESDKIRQLGKVLYQE